MDDPSQVNSSKKIFVLCFDGTGNKFSGTDADSNILKIYRMLDRSQGNQFHYYQPGIGTYVTTSSLDHTSLVARFQSWYDKAKDSAVGTSFANHVMGGYRFLMRYYSPGDDIYFFGFSRGAYTARFLAEMLDHVGLLSAGNEELTRFAWKTFSKWQARRGGNGQEGLMEEKKMYEFMQNFRETFSRPVRRIRFLGLFDTVNSVPRFESAWMQRSKFPYTARSSAKVIRHAVSINERRAKFRQDLITSSKIERQDRNLYQLHRYQSDFPGALGSRNGLQSDRSQPPVPTLDLPDGQNDDLAGPVETGSTEGVHEILPAKQGRAASGYVEHFSGAYGHQLTDSSQTRSQRKGRMMSMAGPVITRSIEDLHKASRPEQQSPRRFSDMSKVQDIEEVWFPGCHADIGGGWPKEETRGEKWQLSHAPLVWMVQEAEAAGLKFDKRKMLHLNCSPDEIDAYGNHSPEHSKAFRNALHQSGTSGFIHDCLEYGGGLSTMSVLSWRLMEYLPFRRMDLQKDGSWKAIRWPLPGGETRDIPEDAKIHMSAIKRMEQDKSYRPGNLIVGGGGRGVKHAPAHYGIGEWDVYKYADDPVKEIYIRRGNADLVPEKETTPS